MQVTSDAFAAAVRTSHERVARVTVLDTLLATVAEITGTDGVVIEGSVSIDANRRRSCTVTIADPDGVWTPAGPADALFPNGVIRLERGILIGGNPELVSLGVFLIDRPRITVDGSGATIAISGQDRVKLAAKSRFSVPETYGAGTPIGEIVLAIATGAGMGGSLFRLDDAGKSLGADRTFEVDADRWPSIVQLATDFALIAYVDADGLVVLEPAPSPDSVGSSVWTFARGAEAIMLGLTKEFSDDRLYNRVRVSGESSDLPPLAAEARDLNPDSPAYNPVDGTGPIGDRLYPYTSPMVRSIDQAIEVANSLILQVALIEELLTVPSVVHPGLEVGDPITIVEELSRTADTYLVDTLQIPLGAGPMTVTARKLRDLRSLVDVPPPTPPADTPPAAGGPGLVVMTLAPGASGSDLLTAVTLDVDVIEVPDGVYDWDGVEIDVDRTTRPLVIRNVAGAEPTIVGSGGTSSGIIFVGLNSFTAHLTMRGFVFDGIALAQAGVFEIRSSDHCQFLDMTFRNLTRDPLVSGSAPKKSWLGYVSMAGGRGHDGLVIARWTGERPVVRRDLSGIQVASSVVPNGSIHLTDVDLTEYDYAFYGEVPTSDLLLDRWSISDCGEASGPASITLQAFDIDGTYRNVHAIASDPLHNFSTGSFVDGGGNSGI